MARIYEYQGKEILREAGISVPAGRCVSTPREAWEAAREIGRPVVIKAQIWATGRAAAGGVKFAQGPEEAKEAAAGLLGREVKGHLVEQVLVEERLEVDREVFVGLVVSSSHRIKGPVLIFSAEGGSSVEEVSGRNPERVGRLNVDYLAGVPEAAARELIDGVSFEQGRPSEEIMGRLARIVSAVYRAFVDYDARALEVNPLIVTTDGRVLAADCHFTLDDNSVFRHPELGIKVPRDMDRPPTDLEVAAWSIEEGDYRGTGYFSQMTAGIEGPGWLGFHGVGGGGAMLGATAFVARGLKIANYADTSGDPPASKIYSVIKYILSMAIDGYVLMGAVLANQEMWHHAHALVKAFREEARKRPGFPVVMLLAGNKEAESRRIIETGFKDLPLKWELYGREYIYRTDFIADRVESLVREYQQEKGR
ncbi:MAG: acetate--CoA ligase family protein [Deltaproteobacteria bacterium]|nr:acetate--CoA ligase family protein [Deltaproteobacteria bacterium]